MYRNSVNEWIADINKPPYVTKPDPICDTLGDRPAWFDRHTPHLTSFDLRSAFKMAHFKDDTIKLELKKMSLNHVLSNENIRERLMSGIKNVYASTKSDWDSSKDVVKDFITTLFNVDGEAYVIFHDNNDGNYSFCFLSPKI